MKLNSEHSKKSVAISHTQMEIFEQISKIRERRFLVRSLIGLFALWLLAALVVCVLTKDYTLLISSSPFAIPFGLVFGWIKWILIVTWVRIIS